MFVIPGFGALLAAGPIVEAIGGAIAGSALGGGTMAGAAALTQLGSALHASGIPEQELQQIHQLVEAGKFIVILHCTPQQKDQCHQILKQHHADPLYDIPVQI